jgi:hypothetical protein
VLGARRDNRDMKRLLSLISISLFLAVLASGQFWHKKEFADWNDQEVQKILRDSPWARPVLISFEISSSPVMQRSRDNREITTSAGSSRDSSCCQDAMPDKSAMRAGVGDARIPDVSPQSATLTVIVRWQSALPVRQAIVKTRFGSEVNTSSEAAKLLESEPQFHVVGVIGLPAQAMQQKREEIKTDAFLRIKGKPPLGAADVLASQEAGSVNLYLLFPKTGAAGNFITTQDQEVEVGLKLGSRNIRRKFKVKDMVYKGKLEA